MIKAVLLDFYGTLAYDVIDFDTTWSSYYHFLNSEFNTPSDYQTYLEALQKTIEWAKYMREVKLHEVTFYQFHSRVLSLLGISVSRRILDSLFSIYLKHKTIYFYQDVDIVLKNLKQEKLKIGLISNANSLLPLIKLKERSLDKYFNKICISSELGIRKPHPYIFKCVLDSLQIFPEEAVMVGDHFKLDIFGAKRLGMRAILIRRTEKSKVHDLKYSPDAIIDDISQLSLVLKNLD